MGDCADACSEPGSPVTAAKDSVRPLQGGSEELCALLQLGLGHSTSGCGVPDRQGAARAGLLPAVLLLQGTRAGRPAWGVSGQGPVLGAWIPLDGATDGAVMLGCSSAAGLPCDVMLLWEACSSKAAGPPVWATC